MGLFDRAPVVPVLRLAGAIGISTPLNPGLSLASTAGPIERAFSFKKAPAVAIVVNSPGGSPVQSRLIYQRIRDKAQETGKRVYVFAEDVAASGGYMIACAGDEIYADPSSIVGSIGVISAGFGLDEFIERYDIKRRVYTAGANKSMLDTFRPEDPEAVARLQTILSDIHDVFTDLVKESRGDKLVGDPTELFDGKVWVGERAVENGLIDGLSDVRTKMRSLFGDKIKLKLIAKRRGLFSSLRPGMSANWEQGAGLSERAATLPEQALAALEEKALWSRFGL
ncbi:MAG: S49 family peptidase [Pseudomonadota bacterium]